MNIWDVIFNGVLDAETNHRISRHDANNLIISLKSGEKCSDVEAGHEPVSSQIRFMTKAHFNAQNRLAELEMKKK